MRAGKRGDLRAQTVPFPPETHLSNPARMLEMGSEVVLARYSQMDGKIQLKLVTAAAQSKENGKRERGNGVSSEMSLSLLPPTNRRIPNARPPYRFRKLILARDSGQRPAAGFFAHSSPPQWEQERQMESQGGMLTNPFAHGANFEGSWGSTGRICSQHYWLPDGPMASSGELATSGGPTTCNRERAQRGFQINNECVM